MTVVDLAPVAETRLRYAAVVVLLPPQLLLLAAVDKKRPVRIIDNGLAISVA